LHRKKSEEKANGKDMRRQIGDSIRSLDHAFSYEVLHSRAQAVESGTEAGFQSPWEIIFSLKSFVESAETFLCRREGLDGLVATYNTLLVGLVKLPDLHREENQRYMERLLEQNNIKVVKAVLDKIDKLLRTETFSIAKAEEFQQTIRGMENSLACAQTRVTSQMDQNARIRMSTIGSSHKLPVRRENEESMEEQFESLNVKDDKTVVIFDESGCIPAFELIGLTRLGQKFDAIVAVGDAKQLPPYDPRQSLSPRPSPRSFRRSLSNFNNNTPIKSILDVSACATKIKLTQQYRVPRDIAAILNARIYNGDYNTPESCRVPHRGFRLVDTPIDRCEKYVNRKEIDVCLDLVRQLHQKREKSIMLLTPVRSKP
jgi:hypothetical protein